MLQGNWQPPSHSFYHVHVFSDIELWCFSFVTLFNLQGTRPARLSGGTLTILAHLRSFVKYFFRLFQIFFRARSRSRGSQTACLFYQNSLALSSPFFDFLETFFKLPVPRAVSLTACLIYQINHHLSTTFFNFFGVFFASYQRHFPHIVI